MLELPLLALAFAKNPLIVCLGGEELPDTHAESIGKNITEGWKGERVRRSRVKHLLAMCVACVRQASSWTYHPSSPEPKNKHHAGGQISSR